MVIELLGLLALAFGGSGKLRLSNAKDRYKLAAESYQDIQARCQVEEVRRATLIGELAAHAAGGIKWMSKANRMLLPLEGSWSKATLALPTARDERALALLRSRSISTEFYAAAGLATGAATAGALWCGASILGISSTGLPIVFLHGAALHNAAMACLGGGALASGGGGMVLGGAVLASAVVVPAAIVFGFKSHSAASELNRESEQIESANTTNLVVLTEASRINSVMQRVEGDLRNETKTFSDVVTGTYRRLFRFGFLSHCYRRLRARFWGEYYSESDMEATQTLGDATARYVDFFDGLRNEFCNSK